MNKRNISGNANFQRRINPQAFEQPTLTMQLDLVAKLQKIFKTYPDVTIHQLTQAFNCSYTATNRLYGYLNNCLCMATWLDNPEYSEELCEQLRTQARDALVSLPQNMQLLQDKKLSLINAANALQGYLAENQINFTQIEQDFPNLLKVKQLVEQADLLIQQVTGFLAKNSPVNNTATVPKPKPSP